MKDKWENPIKYHLILTAGLLLVVAGEQWLGSLELTVLGTAVIGLGMASKRSFMPSKLPRR